LKTEHDATEVVTNWRAAIKNKRGMIFRFDEGVPIR